MLFNQAVHFNFHHKLSNLSKKISEFKIKTFCYLLVIRCLILVTNINIMKKTYKIATVALMKL